jgi:hypothetical protein
MQMNAEKPTPKKLEVFFATYDKLVSLTTDSDGIMNVMPAKIIKTFKMQKIKLPTNDTTLLSAAEHCHTGHRDLDQTALLESIWLTYLNLRREDKMSVPEATAKRLHFLLVPMIVSDEVKGPMQDLASMCAGHSLNVPDGPPASFSEALENFKQFPTNIFFRVLDAHCFKSVAIVWAESENRKLLGTETFTSTMQKARTDLTRWLSDEAIDVTSVDTADLLACIKALSGAPQGPSNASIELLRIDVAKVLKLFCSKTVSAQTVSCRWFMFVALSVRVRVCVDNPALVGSEREKETDSVNSK